MKLITITGSSGVGKDTVARLLSAELQIPVLVSYTTRPMREGEQNGREHYFVPECQTDKKEMLAYTVYSEHEYWTEVSQLSHDAIYVIDEEGLRNLHDRFPHIPIVSIYVRAIPRVRRSRGVTEDRMKRDLLREQFPLTYYDHRISNNGTLASLKSRVAQLAKSL